MLIDRPTIFAEGLNEGYIENSKNIDGHFRVLVWTASWLVLPFTEMWTTGKRAILRDKIKSLVSVQFSRSVVSDSLQPHESQHARPPCPSPSPGVHSDSRPRISDAIQPSHPRSSPSPPAPNPSQHQSLFQWVNSSHEVAKVLEFQL